MKKDYETPQIELLRLLSMDILTASGDDGDVGEDLEGSGSGWPMGDDDLGIIG